MWHYTSDGSVVDSRGRILYFSCPRFISDICQGNDCFICGAKPNTVGFNNEHILPDWVLRRYNLHNRVITLPNGRGFRYGEFKIPCCIECNKIMGTKFEAPISELFSKGHSAVSQELKDNGPLKLFCWMSLIFLKAHLKDTLLNFHFDRRKGDMKMGELSYLGRATPCALYCTCFPYRLRGHARGHRFDACATCKSKSTF